MVALQIAREPLVRQVLRQTFQERAKLNITPTKKGRKVSWGKAAVVNSAVLNYIYVEPIGILSSLSKHCLPAHAPLSVTLGCGRGPLRLLF